MMYEYKGELYPEYLKDGNATRFIVSAAMHFCKGKGLDVGAGKWGLPGATPIDLCDGKSAMELPDGPYDYVYSSHCLEHLPDYVAALEHWKSRIRSGGVLFLYLPHPDMRYWRPENCRKHKHIFWPKDMAQLVTELGFTSVIHSERDLAWSFAVVGVNP